MSVPTPPAASPVRGSARIIGFSLLLDIVLVVIFAVIGRSSHAEQVDVAGVWQTAWPFLVGLLAGWAVAMAWRAPMAPVRTGVAVWALTLVAGMLLRIASGQGVVIAFVIVASIVLLVFLVGWRVIATLVRRRVRSR